MRRIALIVAVTAIAVAAYGKPRVPELPVVVATQGPALTPLATTTFHDTVWYGGTTWAPDSSRWEALRDSVWTFDTGVGSSINTGQNPNKPIGYHETMEGWVGVPLSSDSDIQFRRSTNCAIAGSHSMWAGKTQAEADAACWSGGAGYGNGMWAVLEQTFAYPGTGDVALQFNYAVDAETGFDQLMLVARPSDAGSDVVLDTWDGVASGLASFTLRAVDGTVPVGAGTVTIRFIAASDGSYSDQDGLYTTTCGLAAVDNIQLSGAISHSADFEASDDGWTVPIQPPVIDDFSHLAAVNDLPPPSGFTGRCGAVDSALVFLDQNGEHPAGQWNMAASPWIDLKANGDVGRNLLLVCDAYTGTNAYVSPNHNYGAQYYPWSCPVTGEIGVSPIYYVQTLFYFGYPTCGRRVRDLNQFAPPGAEQVRVFVGPHWFESLNTDAGPWFDNIRVGVYGLPTSAVPETPQPPSAQLSVAHPNPLRTTTRISFTTPADGHAKLTAYDVAGRHVRTLVDATLPAGPHDVTWDATDDAGQRVAAGLYFYRLTAGDYSAARKVVVAR